VGAWQESGRANNDGKMSRACLVHKQQQHRRKTQGHRDAVGVMTLDATSAANTAAA